MAFSSIHLFFDDVEIGQEWISLGRTINIADIVNFAGVSGDFNPIHMDHHFAQSTPFRKPVAHGLLIWAVSSGLGAYAPPMRTIAFLSIRDWTFQGPVYVGDTIRLHSRVLEKEERARGRRGVITWKRTILNQDDKVVHEGITTTLVEGRANIRKNPEG